MLPSENRLKQTDNFDEIREKGKLVQKEDFAVNLLKKEAKEKPKFGIIVSKKISSLAVSRNRIKRAVFEALRRNVKTVPEGYRVVFLVKKGIARKTTAEIMESVQEFIRGYKF